MCAGLILLAFHHEKAVRDWSRQALKSSEKDITVDDIAEAEQVITSVYHTLAAPFSEAGSDVPAHLYSRFLEKTYARELVKGLGRCIGQMKVCLPFRIMFILTCLGPSH